MKIYYDLEFRYYSFANQAKAFASVIAEHCAKIGIVPQSERKNTICTSSGLDYAYSVKEVNGYFEHALIIYNKDKKIELTDEPIYKVLAIKLFSTLDCILGTVKIFKEENHFEYENLLAVEFLAFHLPPQGMLLMDKKRWNLYNEYPRSIRFENEAKSREGLSDGSFVITTDGWFSKSKLEMANVILKDSIWLGQSEAPGLKYACYSIVMASLSLAALIEGILKVTDKNENISFPKSISQDWTDLEEPVSQEVYLGPLLNILINHPGGILENQGLAKYIDEILKQNGSEILQNRGSALVSFMVNRSAIFTVGDKDFLIFFENYDSDKNQHERVYIRTIGTISDLTSEQLKFLDSIKNNLKGKAILGVNGNDCWILSDITPENYKEYLDKNDFIQLINIK